MSVGSAQYYCRASPVPHVAPHAGLATAGPLALPVLLGHTLRAGACAVASSMVAVEAT